jgi:hypothetical protein
MAFVVPVAVLEAADYARRAARGADPVGSDPPYELKYRKQPHAKCRRAD